MKKAEAILVLPSWYPSRVDNFAGDFIQRHVHAIALFKKQFVLYVIKDLKANKRKEICIHEHQKFTEKIIYYRPIVSGVGFIDKIISHRSYMRLMKNAVKEFITAEGLPKMVHVHVGMKAGMNALWIKKKWGTPYIVSEHWSGYLSQTPEYVCRANLWFKKQLARVLINASCVTGVSQYLTKAIQAFQPVTERVVVPNVVDTKIFSHLPIVKEKIFIHASTMNYPKNVEAIIHAMAEVNKVFGDAQLHLFGQMPVNIKLLIKTLHLENTVIYKGEVSQQELANAMQAATVLILYSRYETFGCVIIEAHACKLPVIVSDLPVFHELVLENKNGVFVEPDAHKKLAEKMIGIMQTRFEKKNFNVEQYTYEAVGKKFKDIYESLSI